MMLLRRPATVALTDGFQAAFWVGAAFTFVGVLVSLFLVRGRDLPRSRRRTSWNRLSSRPDLDHSAPTGPACGGLPLGCTFGPDSCWAAGGPD